MDVGVLTSGIVHPSIALCSRSMAYTYLPFGFQSCSGIVSCIPLSMLACFQPDNGIDTPLELPDTVRFIGASSLPPAFPVYPTSPNFASLLFRHTSSFLTSQRALFCRFNGRRRDALIVFARIKCENPHNHRITSFLTSDALIPWDNEAAKDYDSIRTLYTYPRSSASPPFK